LEEKDEEYNALGNKGFESENLFLEPTWPHIHVELCKKNLRKFKPLTSDLKILVSSAWLHITTYIQQFRKDS
jgi:hypothetical protein